jgi:signal transduction histidine kinase
MPGVGAPRTVGRVFRPLRPYQRVVDVVVAVAFALVMVPGELAYGIPVSGAAPVVAMPLVFAVVLAFRRLAPGLALAAAWVGALVQVVALIGPRPSDVVIFAVLYATAAYGTRATYWLGFASAFGGALVITVYLFAVQIPLTPTLSTLTTAFAVLVAALFALLLAWVSGALVRTALRARESRRAREEAEAETAAEHERVRIARDMHDVVAHSLAVVIAQADGARYAAASDPAATTAALATISSTARAALGDVRLLLAQLRHREGAGPQPTLADVEALYAQVRAAGVELRIEVDPVAPPPAGPGGAAGDVPAAVQLAVYRILQEALTNALRHGAPGPVHVHQAWLPDRVELSVRNPVRQGAPPAGPGHGLIGMRERALLVGGRIDAGTRGGEFVVEASLPWGAPA